MLDHKRFLIVRLSSIGDVLHATPIAESLKAAAPSCHITWLVSTTAASLLKYNPHIDQVIVWSREDFANAASHHQFGKMRSLWRQLKKFYQSQHFDIALDIHGLFLTGVITHASKTSRRIGLAKTKELNRFFMTEQAPVISREHVIYRYLSVLKSLNIQQYTTKMTLIPGDDATAFAAKFWLKHQVAATDKVLFVNARTSWPSKNWSQENFAQCIDLIDPTIKVFLCGSATDAAFIQQLCSLVTRPVINIAGTTTLLELAALLQRAELLLTGDTGVLHMAIAVGTPTISLWGPTRPEQYGPLATANHRIIRSAFTCVACHKTSCRHKDNGCMNAILPQTVSEVVNNHFGK